VWFNDLGFKNGFFSFLELSKRNFNQIEDLARVFISFAAKNSKKILILLAKSKSKIGLVI
jgi:hypothetical protein